MIKKFVYIFVILFFIQSCDTSTDIQENASASIDEEDKVATTIKDTISTSRNSETSEVFSLFLKKFNSDCEFQKERVQFPLKIISLMDFEINDYDTTFMSKVEYECMEFTEPKSNIMDGQVNLKFNYNQKNVVVITLGVEDTGVHIKYEFKLFSKYWMLTKITDEST